MSDEEEDGLDGNGHGDIVEIAEEEAAFPGGRVDLDKLKRTDGIITTMGGQSVGIMQKIVTANKEADYRQAIKTANFMSIEESDRVVAAYDERRRYGVDTRAITDWVEARKSVKGWLVEAVIRSFTRRDTTFTSNKARWGLHGKSDKKSPLD